MGNKFLWKFEWDCGRQGDLEGLFVAAEEEIKGVIGKDAYFGEALGKHSEVYGTIEKGDIAKVELDHETVEKVAAILGQTWSGYNPLHYISYECDRCGYNYHADEFNKEKNMCVYCSEEGEGDK